MRASADPQAIEAALAITLLAPWSPMLFMGEEWGANAPFPFFCDFKGELAEAVRKGRRKEFAGAYAKYGDEMPDPLDAVDLPVRGARLGRARQRPDSKRLDAGARTARVRRREIVPRLAGARSATRASTDSGLLTAHWRMGDGATLR